MLLIMAADLLTIGGALLLAYWLRFHSRLVPPGGGYSPADYLWFFPWAWVIWFLALRFENLYRRRSKILDFNVVRRIMTGSLLALLVLFAFSFFVRRENDFSRVLMPLALASVVTSLLIERAILDRVFAALTRKGHFGLTRTLILGGGPVAARVFENLRAHPEHGMAPIGVVIDPSLDPEKNSERANLNVLGEIDDLESILERHGVEEVILAQPELDRSRIPAILVQCEQRLASFRIVPDTTELLFSGMTVETLDGIPFLGVRETSLQGWNAALKRLIDLLAAAFGLILASPLMIVIARLIRRHDDGPILYVQKRMGIDGLRFEMYKFRTMRVGTEGETGPVFAEERDSRCTPIGLWLRKYRLDELPQLINVLKGDMSLVGPRPERPYFIEQFLEDIPRYMTRHRVKSGITGWAQINGLSGRRGSISERLKYDLYYIENWSLWLDLKILLLTLYHQVRLG